MVGDASEIALMKFFQPFQDIVELRNSLKLARQFDNSEAIIGFNSAFKFALNIFELENDSEHSHVVWIKGAPERVWKKCGFVLMNGQKTKIDEGVVKKFDNSNEHFAKNGERVLGFGRILLKKD